MNIIEEMSRIKNQLKRIEIRLTQNRGATQALSVTEDAVAFKDNFDDSVKFWAWREFNTDAATTITEAGGKLSFHIDNGTDGTLTSGADNGPYSLIGVPSCSCIIETKCENFTPAADNSGGILISRYPGNAAAWNWIGIFRHKSATFDGLMVYRAGGVLATQAAWTTDPFWLRICVSGFSTYGQNILFQYSSDGLSWTTLWTETSGSFTYSHGWMAGPFIRNAGVFPVTDMDFDYFKIIPSFGPG